jgi:hypothetical protein
LQWIVHADFFAALAITKATETCTAHHGLVGRVEKARNQGYGKANQ